ncbi:helix-turn-helix domain-containing protein [Halodesulfurarchaeum formicicum]|uniref:Bacterio-opsin activator HTH domain-containing protein n=1 Tax=Halodesulfurarchaeum formicicum TaxID=1873524 RepID=A0A1J1AEA3_9EURY|nr:helix-turn-helix domain-containing protein [Halodesulfurarchaeum formicicum]APE96055.1 bacterio-opsin activator HTH domain-containing protein [Halodesulfurarchaeum formicicum]
MANDVAGATRAQGDRSTQRLFVELDVELADTHPCPLCRFEESIVDVRHQVGQKRCHLDAKMTDSYCSCPHECTTVEHIETQIQPDCACPVFVKYGCVPQVTESDGSTVLMKTYLTDRERLSDLIGDLRAAVESVSVRRLKRVDTQDERDRQKFVTLDLYELTQKQRQAITAAVAAGYYETPREVSLGELADRLDISKSALSQRLKAAESKLVTGAFSRASAGQ